MIAPVLDKHIELTAGVVGGRPRIVGRRITVQNIAIWHEQMGKSADEICAEHDLSLAELYAALAYYFDHREEIDQQITADAAFAEALRHESPSLLAQKLHTIRHE